MYCRCARCRHATPLWQHASWPHAAQINIYDFKRFANCFIHFNSFQEFNYQGQHYKVCVFKVDNGYISAGAYTLIFFSSSYVLPLILISGLYLRMCMRLWHTGVLANNRSPDSHRGRKRVTRLVVVVVAAFASLWFPIQVLHLIA